MCTLFATRHQAEVVVGRNFDWIQRGGCVHFIPPYSSYGQRTFGVCLLEQMGADQPFEGMNTQGVFLGLAAVPSRRGPPPPHQASVHAFHDLGIVRYVLERAASTDQALALMKQFTLEYRLRELNFHHHHLIADSQGHVAVYEEGFYESLRGLEVGEWEAMSNVSHAEQRETCPRYTHVARAMSQGLPDAQTTTRLLQEVQQPGLTVWSTTYELQVGSMRICPEGDYELIHTFNLHEQLQQGTTAYPFTALKLRDPKYIEQYRFPSV